MKDRIPYRPGLTKQSSESIDTNSFARITQSIDPQGNLHIVSRQYSFVDSLTNRQRPAEMIAARNGIDFIRSHTGLLQSLDSVLSIATKTSVSRTFSFGVETLEDFALRLHRGQADRDGDSSRVFVLNSLGDNYLIKTRSNSPNRHIPYQDEMVLVQLIANQFQDKLDKVGIQLPNILLATDSVSISEYVPGGPAERNDIDSERLAVLNEIAQHIRSEQANGNQMWMGIELDYMSGSERRQAAIPRKFRKMKDGQLLFTGLFKRTA